MSNLQELEKALDGNIHVVMSSGSHIYTMGAFWSIVYIAVFLVGVKHSGDFILRHIRPTKAQPQHIDDDDWDDLDD